MVKQPEQARGDATARFMAHNPRLSGVLFLLIALVAAGLNATLLRREGVYFPSAFILVGGAIGFFSWVIVTGRTAAAGAPKAPGWWKAGAIASAAVGIGLGAYVMSIVA
jgi:hypothetical protein